MVDLGFGPGERLGAFIVGLDEVVDMGAQLGDGMERSAGERLVGQDGEPNLDLVEPGGARRREVEVHVRMTVEPAILLGFVGVEIVEDDVDLPLGMLGHDPVHEIEELDAPAAAVMLGADLAAGDVEGGEQGGGAVPLVIVRLAAERAPIGQLR